MACKNARPHPTYRKESLTSLLSLTPTIVTSEVQKKNKNNTTRDRLAREFPFYSYHPYFSCDNQAGCTCTCIGTH